MSKQAKIIIISFLTLIVLGWAGWQLLKPKTKDSYESKEISIKQADVPNVETKTYDDWSGFKFDYPSLLTVKEVELDNPQIYSSLEIYGSDGKKMTVRINDTALPDLAAWQKTFSQNNSVKKIDQAKLDGLNALRLQYGAPAMMITVAIKDGIIYQIESPVDDGFWNRTHADLTDSFKFAAAAATTPAASEENENITLVEEVIE